MSNFNPNEHIVKLQGKDYLEVKWRLLWFREEHPMGSIQTELVHYEDGLAIVKATVIVEGVIIATGIANADSRNSKPMWKGKEIMKAETAAQGRALAVAGYGTQFTGEEEGDFLADSPVEPAPKKVIPLVQPTQQAKSNGKGVTTKKVIPLAQPVPNRVETSSNGKVATSKPQWKPAEMAKFNDNISIRFPGFGHQLQAGIKAELKITRWDELGTQIDAINVLYPRLYALCAPVLVDRMRYVVDGKAKYLEFSVNENADIHPPIRAYGRSTVVKDVWLTDYAYTIALGWDNFDKATKTTQWADIGQDIVLFYERNDHGTLIATGMGHNIVDPQLVEMTTEQATAMFEAKDVGDPRDNLDF